MLLEMINLNSNLVSVLILVLLNFISIALYVKTFEDKLDEEDVVSLYMMSINLSLIILCTGLLLLYYGK